MSNRLQLIVVLLLIGGALLVLFAPGADNIFLSSIIASERPEMAGSPERIRHAGVFFLAMAVAIAAMVILFLIRKRQELESRYRAIVHNAAEGIALLEPENFEIIEANDAFVRLIGGHGADVIGTSFPGRMEEAAPREIILRTLTGRREICLRHADGTQRVAEMTANPIPYRGMQAIALIVRDTTERRHLEEQLVHQANHDALTGLPNRNLLNDRLRQSLAEAARQQRCLSLALIDLDNFKLVNDNLGHAAGDRLLVAVAERLQSCCRASDTLARLGGDEFVLLSTGLDRAENAIRIAENFRKVLVEPFLLDSMEIHVTATIGIAQYPEDGAAGEELLRKADTAMYHVKARGKNGFEFFNEEMNQILRERTAVETQLRHAIERNELCIHYQPKISLDDGAICGLEALLRWRNSELGEVPPARFIPIAEETGLILPLGEWVLRTAIGQLRQWRDEGLPVRQLAINISARQFAHPALIETIQSVLDQTGLEPGLLELELTESLMMQNATESIQRMFQLKELGIGISVDDFGVGYSSLGCISQFPIDSMKIDRSFVAGIQDDPIKNSIVRMIIAMAHTMGLRVVAVGVETMEQMEFIRMQQCEEMQGYLFSHPLPAAELGDLLREWTPALRKTALQG